MDRFLLRLAATLTLLVFSGPGSACDELSRSAEPPRQAEAAAIPTHDYSELDPEDILDLTELRPAQLRRLSTGQARVFPPCRELFEEDGAFLDWPFEEGAHQDALFGCDPEAQILLRDGRAVAYASTTAEERVANLQVLVFESDGRLRWTHAMDRSQEAPNYTANYRGSFLTAVDDRLLCGGTLFQGGTQTFCARQDTGEVVYEGRLDFWAGLVPFAFEGALISADLRGITARYPFTGAEMRHRALPGRGGRAAFYATDEERVFFSPAEDDPLLTGWSLQEMSPIWEALLPGRPRVTFQATSLEHELLLLKVGTTLFGIDTGDGSLRMSFEVADTFPPVAFSEDTVYLLLRRTEEPALIYALDPLDGEVRWVAMAPSGTLDLTFDEELLVRSVRAVRTVRFDEADPDDG
jgi:hypothetical protein